MKAAEFNAAALRLGLSNPGMADVLGIDVRKVRGFSAGTRDIPKVVALACWALVMRPRIAEAAELLKQE